ncbi:tyrosine-type recombinase/integrase [Telmatospirillum sp. J64-1]|uniref:tyrosine-type recombinase/integrase n=1 Tax=Telmatospirillum sp. J64-1 TaxID=2502183 RepID=UPI00115EE52C|nr:tyrosine-type recombinase/integrase [Telmatospirillum sp. J64-1]
MAVRQRGKSWQVDITLKGERYRLTFPSEKEARAWEMKASAASLAGEPIPPANGTTGTATSSRPTSWSLGAACDRAFHEFWRGSEHGKKVRWSLNEIRQYFGDDTPLERIGTEEISAFTSYCEAQGNSNGTINRKLAALSKVLRHAYDCRALSHLPKMNRRKEAKGRFRWLTEKEEQAILATLRQWEKHDHAEVITVLIDTGMRNSELWRLEGRDINLKEGAIHIWQTKTDKPRTVYMTRRVRKIIERRMTEAASPTVRLFPYDNPWLRYTWDRVRGHLGLMHDPNFVPYICRHTCASRMVQRGVSLQVVKEWLGHATIEMTMRYAFLAPTQLKGALNALDRTQEEADTQELDTAHEID